MIPGSRRSGTSCSASHEAGRQDWHCFTLSRYDRQTGKWAMEKAPVHHIID